MSQVDMAMNAFMDSAKKIAPHLPHDLLMTIYNIQKNHQYEDKLERNSMREMEKAVDAYVDSIGSGV